MTGEQELQLLEITVARLEKEQEAYWSTMITLAGRADKIRESQPYRRQESGISSKRKRSSRNCSASSIKTKDKKDNRI
jgi:hypothetical protein